MRNGLPRRTLAPEFAEASVWSVRPLQLASLFEMLTYHAGLFHLYCSELRTLIDGLTHGVHKRGGGSVVTEDEIREVLCHNLCVVIQSVHELGIDATLLGEMAA